MSVSVGVSVSEDVSVLESLEFVIPCWESVHGQVDYHGPAEEGAFYWLKFTCLFCESSDVAPACTTFVDCIDETDGLECPNCGMNTPALEGMKVIGKIDE